MTKMEGGAKATKPFTVVHYRGNSPKAYMPLHIYTGYQILSIVLISDLSEKHSVLKAPL